MSESGHGGSAQKRFSGDGNSGAAELKVWKRWACAALAVMKVGGMPPETLGHWKCCGHCDMRHDATV